MQWLDSLLDVVQELHQLQVDFQKLLDGLQCSAHDGWEWSGPTTTLNVVTTSIMNDQYSSSIL